MITCDEVLKERGIEIEYCSAGVADGYEYHRT